ncbi:oxidoreductase [Halomicrococcus sp. SG-WS-1]|uniref:oxidoreductase n=1 Tax=Halomicrococcus sp. SG-WS-1 TaxID=3439057 RepID=UPI003F7956AF
MNVEVLGGGPGGLYASLLCQKSNPDWDVSVHEKYPADSSYGWGVVFSDATLSSLREADYETHERITEAFVQWDPIDVYYGGERHRCGGHTFAGIMRTDLLEILQDRCRELGVDLNFEVEIDSPQELREDADLLVGADGIASTVREEYADRFEPNVSEGNAKFAWYGTEKPFDVFTFIFRENDDGLWQIHAYPGETSTFIVECSEETWRNAGLDEKSEAESLAYFEDLFADHLDGYGLKSKQERWRNFRTVKNRNWHFDDVVLVGDAAASAHFTIGAGTKMAMEDAIALWEGFKEHGTDVSAALNRYEMDRRDKVSALQTAADRSRRYFEHVDRYLHMDPEQFTVHLLTRSGRITYDNLRVRDTGFVDDYDSWFANRADGANPGTLDVATPPLFTQFDLDGVSLSNRVVKLPADDQDATDGLPSAAYRDALVEAGRSGAGLVLTDPVAVAADGRITPRNAGIYADDHREAWTDAVGRIHDAGDAKVAVQLSHAGRRGAMRPRSAGLDRPLPDEAAWPLLAPSSKPFSKGTRTPTAMDDDDRERVLAAFESAATRAAEAGFDVAQLHVGHGYLLNSFLSPFANERDDEYGGSLENRMRFPLAVFETVRDAWPDDGAVTVTLQATDWHPNGFKTRESYALAERLAERGCALAAVVAGQASPNGRPRYDPQTLGRLSDRIRNTVEIPTMATNYVTTTDGVNTLVGSGRADLAVLYDDEL